MPNYENTPALIGQFNQLKFELKMMWQNLGVYCASQRHFQILFLENFETEWFVTTQRRMERIFPT